MANKAIPKRTKTQKRHPLTPGHSMYCIFRIEPSIHGLGGYWQVTLKRAGISYNASFFDRAYKNERQALYVAQTFRDALLKRMPPLTLLRVNQKRKTASGIKGVCRIMRADQPYWQAQLNIEGKNFRRIFRISEYGEKKARQLAIEARTTWLKEFELKQVPSLPSQEEIQQLAKEIGTRFGENKPIRPPLRKTYNKQEKYGISRREANARGGGGYWKVALSRRGIMYAKNFYDATEGGKKKAFIVASRYRDNLLANTQPLTNQERCQLVRSDNTSGVPGVRLVKRNGVPSSWQARICLHGKEKNKNFSINTYGEPQAFALAVQARQDFLKQINEEYYVHSPVAKKLYRNKK